MGSVNVYGAYEHFSFYFVTGFRFQISTCLLIISNLSYFCADLNDMEDFKVTLKQQIIDSLNLQGMKPGGIDDNAPLFGEGLGLDSIDSLELMVLLERNYGIKIEDAREGRKVLTSVQSMAEYIQANRKI